MLDRRLKMLTHPALLVVDEIGYLPVTQSGAVLFFQLINRRYGNASTRFRTTCARMSGYTSDNGARHSWLVPNVSSVNRLNTASR